MIQEWILQILLAVIGVIAGSTVYYYLSQQQKIAALWAGFAAVVLLTFCVTLYIRNAILAKEIQAETPVFNGRIIASNEKTSMVPPDTFSLLLGDDLQVLTRSYDNSVFTKDGKPFLTLRRKGKFLLVSATIVDKSGKGIVKIIDNEFQASQERAFNPKQPDEHTLVVRDFDGNEVLNVRYLNPRAIRLVGRFQIPGINQPVVIDPVDGIRWPGGIGLGHMTIDVTDSPVGIINF